MVGIDKVSDYMAESAYLFARIQEEMHQPEAAIADAVSRAFRDPERVRALISGLVDLKTESTP